MIYIELNKKESIKELMSRDFSKQAAISIFDFVSIDENPYSVETIQNEFSEYKNIEEIILDYPSLDSENLNDHFLVIHYTKKSIVLKNY